MECPVCLEIYSAILKPKLLIPCGHSLCTVCLESLKDCPLCKKIIYSSIVNYSLLDCSLGIFNNKVPVEKNKSTLDIKQIIEPDLLNQEQLTNEQMLGLRFLNEKIEQIVNFKNPRQETKCHPMPSNIFNNSVGLCGRGGVGKTRVLVEIINFWANFQKKRVCFVAHTHNAVNIMKNMLNCQNISFENIAISTFSKLVRRNVSEKGKLCLAKARDYLNSKKNFKLVGYFDLIIVDESSMISVQDLFDISCRIYQEKAELEVKLEDFPCFLFSGDYRQLGPVNENGLCSINSWGNVISDVLFSNKEKSIELKTILRSSDTHIQRLCDSVGNELESNFNSKTKIFSLNNYTTAKAIESKNVNIFQSVDDGIRLYCHMLQDNNMNTVWLHYNNSVHPNTLDLNRNIRLNYFTQYLGNQGETMKDYFIGEYFMYNHNYLSIEDNLNKHLHSKNPFLSINLAPENLSRYWSRERFLNQSFFEIVKNRVCVRLISSNIVPNEKFKIIHVNETLIKTKNLLKKYGQKFAQGICVDANHKIKLETMFLISSNKPNYMVMILNKIDLDINFGTFCDLTKRQKNLSIKFADENIWSLASCSYKDNVSTINPILKMFDFKKIFPINYVNSIQTFQGSSVDNVFIGEYNLRDAQHLTNIGLYTHLYTALSRAKKRIIIVE